MDPAEVKRALNAAIDVYGFDAVEVRADPEDPLTFEGQAFIRDPTDEETPERFLLHFLLTFVGREDYIVCIGVRVPQLENQDLDAALSNLFERQFGEALQAAGFRPMPHTPIVVSQAPKRRRRSS